MAFKLNLISAWMVLQSAPRNRSITSKLSFLSHVCTLEMKIYSLFKYLLLVCWESASKASNAQLFPQQLKVSRNTSLYWSPRNHVIFLEFCFFYVPYICFQKLGLEDEVCPERHQQVKHYGQQQAFAVSYFNKAEQMSEHLL